VPRFSTFAILSVALHAGLFFAGAGAVARRAPDEAEARKAAGAGPTTSAVGATAAIGGETFEVPELTTPEDESAAATTTDPIELDGPKTPATTSAAQTPPGEADPAEPGVGPAPRATKAPAHAARGGHHSSAAAPPPEPVLYGAVGDRAAGDLVDTFKRTFPIAASHDALWSNVPIGFYAGGDVTFTLAADGALEHATTSANAAPAFRTAIERTVALLKHRVFTAKGAVTRLHMVVRVSDQVVNHCAFTIDARGNFDLPSCRHISVTISER
jgi:hypothetical protein